MAEERNEPVEEGGWGWGWLSEAAKAAKSAYDTNVKPALESMEKTTSQFVQEVTKAIDLPEEDVEMAPEAEIDREKNPESSYPPDEVSLDRDPVEEPQEESILSDAMGGIAYLGESVKKLVSQIGDVENVEATLKRGKEKFVTAVGEAYSFITEDSESQQTLRGDNINSNQSNSSRTPSKQGQSGVPNTPSAFPSTPGTPSASSSTSTSGQTSSNNATASQSSRPSLASPTFNSLFEAKLGAVDFASLENLSMQSSLVLQQLLRKMSEDQRSHVVAQQEKLRSIFALDSLADPASALNLATFSLPNIDTTETLESENVGDESLTHAREQFKTQLEVLNQKIAFYASRTSSLQGFALKALNECVIPENGDIKILSEGTLNYRGKMQLEALRQLAEFTALAVHQILLLTELIQKESATKNSEASLILYAEIVHNLALTCKDHVSSISAQMIASMRLLGNTFKEKATGPIASSHPETASLGPATLKRISAGISNVQLDLATATSSIIDASRFTLAVFQQLQAQTVKSSEN